MAEQSGSSGSSKRSYAYVTILVLLVVNTAVLALALAAVQNRMEALDNRIAEQNNEIQDLQNQIEILDTIDETGVIPWPTIYNQLKDSVVLIQTNLGLGSGFVYDTNGHIITNYHVIQDATTIQVTFLDGTITSATVIGTDIYSDLAVVKVDPKLATLQPVVLGSSSDLDVGEPVAAMGNPFGLSDTLTVGIVSSLGRTMDAAENYVIIDVIQIDAAINPGNSGGVLVNIKGQVVGVNTAIQSETGTFTGIGFAIPSDTVKREIEDLIEKGTYHHPWLGIVSRDITISLANEIGLDEAYGALVIDVTENGPADLAGLRGGDRTAVIEGQLVTVGGDVIVEVDGITVRRLADLVVYMERNNQPGDTAEIVIIRDGQQQTITVTLGERPLP
ncbi:MAG: trypsin-like peptidase domain-containing protein [Candidatus Bathyarchaeota archaeon]|nr:trypsin-like peptidase domain-containing protein [Candidatus Bathyarchaeota archaeon]